MIGKIFFCKNKYHIGVVHVPSFHLSARSSSFLDASSHLYEIEEKNARKNENDLAER